MKSFKVIFWAIFLATMGIYAAMLVWTLPSIQQEAGGLVPFDLRPTGYTYEEAMAFILSLSENGRKLYLGPQRWLDIIYPAGLALTIGLAIAALVPLTKVWKFLFAIVAVPGMCFDYLENGAVRSLLLTTPDTINATAVETASRYTVLKSVFDTAAFVVLIAMLILWFIRRLRLARRLN